MTDVATMKIVANDVRPEATPSIGTGKASAIVEAAKRANTPSSVRPLGPEAAKLQAAATAAAAPASPTETTTGRTRSSSSETPAPTRRLTGVDVNASGPGGLSRAAASSLRSRGAADFLATGSRFPGRYFRRLRAAAAMSSNKAP